MSFCRMKLDGLTVAWQCRGMSERSDQHQLVVDSSTSLVGI